MQRRKSDPVPEPPSLLREKGESVNFLEEVCSFTKVINKELADVNELKDRLPISTNSVIDFSEALDDGVIVIYLL